MTDKHVNSAVDKLPAPIIECVVPNPEAKESISDDSIIEEVDLVKFEQFPDPENPKDWSVTRKWIITVVLAATGFNRILVSTIMAPALPAIAAELHMNSIQTLMSMSVYLLATAVGPLVIGPLSEVYGRQPILHGTGIWFLGWNIVCGFAKSQGVLTAARLLAGLGAGAAYVLAGSVLGDVWDADKRGVSLGLSTLIQNLAAAVGPIVGAIITQRTNWRWIFWSTSVFQLIIVVASVPIFRETYGPLLLQRKAARLRRETGNDRLISASEKHFENRSARWVLQRSLSRPIRLLIFHPIVMINALLSAFCYGITYLVVTTYSDLFTQQYGESIETSGLHYVAMCIGSVIGSQVGGPLMDFIFHKLTARANGEWTPEFHLPIMFPGAVFMVIGFLWYGWCAEKKAFWVNVDLGSAVLSFGSQLLGLPLTAYIIDVYPEHASSAQSAVQLARSLTAFAFPLFAPSMYSAMGYGWANTMLAIVSLLISVPAPLLIWIYGPGLRAKAKTSY